MTTQAFSTGLYFVTIVAILGVWHLKKWGVILYGVLALWGIVGIIQIFTTHPSDNRYLLGLLLYFGRIFAIISLSAPNGVNLSDDDRFQIGSVCLGVVKIAVMQGEAVLRPYKTISLKFTTPCA